MENVDLTNTQTPMNSSDTFTSGIIPGIRHIRENTDTSGGIPVKGAARFVASHAFTVASSPFKIRYIGRLFREEVLSAVESNVPPGEVLIRTISQLTDSAQVKDDLGRKRRAYLYDLAEALKLQPNGEEGVLDVSGGGNFFFPFHMEQVEINAFWKEGDYPGWCLHAYRSVDEMKPGYRIAFREP
jgi:hypothetical protein